MTFYEPELIQVKSKLIIKIEYQKPIDLKDLELMMSSLDILYGKFVKSKLPEYRLHHKLQFTDIRKKCLLLEVQSLISHFYEHGIQPTHDLISTILDFKDFIQLCFDFWMWNSFSKINSSTTAVNITNHFNTNIINNFFQIIYNQPEGKMEINSVGREGDITGSFVIDKDHLEILNNIDANNGDIEFEEVYNDVFFVLDESNEQSNITLGYCLKIDSMNSYMVSIPEQFRNLFIFGRTLNVDLRVYRFQGTIRGYEILNVHGWR